MQTPTLPPGATTTPYHKPGLHTLSQTIFKRRPEAWANLTYLQQPGTNSLDPKTPAPPTPTIAPVDVWLSVGGVDEGDKRLESIGEVPELEEIEVDEEESESDEVSSTSTSAQTADITESARHRRGRVDPVIHAIAGKAAQTKEEAGALQPGPRRVLLRARAGC